MAEGVYPLLISVVIPAYNEAASVGACVRCIRRAFDAHTQDGVTYEVIMVDNASTDDTARRAEEAGAKTVYESHRQIARARNAGARVSTGDWLLFVDADSTPSAELISDMLKSISGGCIVGGGACVRMPGAHGPAQCAIASWNALSRLAHWAAGSFFFTRADAFRESGGFNEELYASEEIDLSKKLKRIGRAHKQSFIILRGPLDTSDRKLRLYTFREHLHVLTHILFHPRRALRNREGLDLWYDGRR